MYDTIEVSHEDRVTLVRINRPKQLNALNSTVAREIIAAVETADRDPAIGAIVLTGSERAFAAGADIAEMIDKTAAEMVAADFFAKWDWFTGCPTPKIAAVNGHALGGGCELMMMCDFAIAGEGAKFGQPEVKLGVVAGMGGMQRMTKLIGRALSMDMHLTGRMTDAAEALRAGLVARVVPDAKVVETALEIARSIAAYSSPAIGLARDLVMQAEEPPLAEGVLQERQRFHRLFGTPDQREGMTAFLEKRAPRFGQPG